MNIPLKISESATGVTLKVETGGGGGGERLPNYIGSYSVVPSSRPVTLPTKNKSMLDDVTIHKIPYAEVSNPSGGMTATIGLE